MTLENEEIADFFEFLSTRITCKWCQHPWENVLPRIGLCSHCNRIRKELKRLETEAAEFASEHGGITHSMDFDLRVQREMVENAKAEGSMYGNIHLGEATGYELEQELRLLGSRFVHKELFKYAANSLDWSFTPLQKQYLFYILSMFHREYMRRNRRRLAMGTLMDDLIYSRRR